MKHAVFAIFILISVTFFLCTCKSSDGYEMKLDAIRVVDQSAKKINMSIWIYDSAGELFRHVFTPGMLDPELSRGSWIKLDDPNFVPIPGQAISDLHLLGLRIKLNPNRFSAPPDATFDLIVEVDELTQAKGNTIERVVTSKNDAYELRVLLRKSY